MLKSIRTKIKLHICTNNYNKKLSQLRNNKNRKIRVLFYVTENSKWGYQSLYEEFKKNDKFEPLVVVSLLDVVHKGKDKTRNNLEENYNFFKTRGMNVKYAYKDHKYVDLKTFKPDIIFYDQPWGLPSLNRPTNVSKFALTCYCSYGFPMYNLETDYRENFHKLLFKFFTDSDINTKRYESYSKGNSKNCVAIGYPKLDEYHRTNLAINNIWRNEDAIKIIYAPHHAFGNSNLNTATFKENGNFILELAKSNPQTSWVFKPHPQFKLALLNNNIMSEKEIDNYYKEWEKVGIIYDKGDYFGLFKNSNLMITDCCSFLGEYLPTTNPIIRLVKENSKPLNDYGKEIVKGYYNVYDNSELEKTFNDLIFNKNDYKRPIRLQTIDKYFKPNIAGAIVKYMSDLLF